VGAGIAKHQQDTSLGGHHHTLKETKIRGLRNRKEVLTIKHVSTGLTACM
jgi:hypothetical protein